MRNLAISIATVLCVWSEVRGQGLKDIGYRFGDEVSLPFLLSISSSAGWDSNPSAGSSTGSTSGPGNGMRLDGEGSAFWQNTFNVHYPLGHGRRRLNLDANYSNTWYLDPPQGTQEFEDSGGLHLDYFRQINERLSLGDAMHLTHQTAPDFQVGASINRPTSGFFYGSNNLWARYNWTTRFSTITSYTVSSISYDDEAMEDQNNLTQTFSGKLRYSLTRRTMGTLDYRFSFSQYPDNPDFDSHSHFVLLGVERPLGRFLSMSLSGGAEFRSYDGPLGDLTEPYSEGAILYHARKNTTFRCYFRSGLEDISSAGTQSGYAQRTGLAMTHQFTPELALNLSLNRVDTDFTGTPGGLGGRKETTSHVSAGLNYSRQLWRRLFFNASYSYSMVSSDDPFADYERHRVALGISAAF